MRKFQYPERQPFHPALSENVPKTAKSVVLEEIAKPTHKSLRTIQRWAKAGRISGASRKSERGHWTVNTACFNLAGVLPKKYHDKRRMLNDRRLRYELNFVLRGITEEDFNTPRDILKARNPEKYEYIYRTLALDDAASARARALPLRARVRSVGKPRRPKQPLRTSSNSAGNRRNCYAYLLCFPMGFT